MVLRDDRGKRRSAIQSAGERLASKMQQDGLKTPPKKMRGTLPTRDALLVGTCRRCGFVAKHATPQDCIDFLRDRIADLSNGAEGKAREFD